MSKKKSIFELVDVKDVKVVRHLTLKVFFEDGVSGEVTIDPSWLTGVFVTLKNKTIFSDVFVENGAVTWVNGLDLAPEPMYAAIKEKGSYHII